MTIIVLFFIVMLTTLTVIVARVLIDMRKRRHEVGEEQSRKLELDTKQRAEAKERQQFEETRRKAEEERKHLEEETRQKAKEEEQECLADELQEAEEKRKRIEKDKLHRAQEEERRKAERDVQEKAEKEELKRVEVEGQRREEEARQKTEGVRGGEQHPPLKRGGRPRAPIKRHEIGQMPVTKPRALKPEVVCWSEGWRWIVGIEVPEELESLSVVQNDELLEQDNTDESRYRLKRFGGAIKITWTKGEKNTLLIGAQGNYIIFKMRKDWKGLGRLVKRPSIGHYLALVPQEWKRDENVSGHAFVAPENIQLDGYKAHFFYLEQNTDMGFITANGERIRMESGGPSFQLVGREIGDASEDMGTLFAEQPPCIQALDEKGWKNVGVIVVGEEGGGRNKWRMQSVPEVGATEQKLPEEIAKKCGGWYFVRIYDNNNNLLESLDFRFMGGLRDICIESSDFLPGTNGHDNVIVQFLHQTDCKVKLGDNAMQPSLEILRESGQTIVTVPPKPDYDKTHWILRDGDAEVEATVLVKRIWWAFGVMGVTPIDWVDKPITLYREDFTPVTDKALWVRLPHMRFVRKIDVGFGYNKSRPYQVEVKKKEITIPLRDFCDTQEIENRREGFEMKIWVQSEEAKPNATVVIKVPSEQPPAIGRKQRKIPKSIMLEEKDSFSQAIIKCRRGKRKGKGFSKKELTEAGIKIKSVKLLNISYDKRRKTSHSWNVESLKYII